MAHDSKPSHLSLHFDGIRVSRQWVDAHFPSVADLCAQSQEKISEATGFSVRVAEKIHSDLLTLLRARVATESVEAVDDPALHSPGNCIPCALWHLRNMLPDRVAAVWDSGFLENAIAMASRLRTYRSCLVQAGLVAEAHVGFEPRVAGCYLVRCEKASAPHCLAVCVGVVFEPEVEAADERVSEPRRRRCRSPPCRYIPDSPRFLTLARVLWRGGNATRSNLLAGSSSGRLRRCFVPQH